MENIEIKNKNIRTDYEASTETEKVYYNLRYSVNNGVLEQVSAVAALKDSTIKGNVNYSMGKYNVGYFPYDAEVIQEVMSDFKNVVELIGEAISSSEEIKNK